VIRYTVVIVYRLFLRSVVLVYHYVVTVVAFVRCYVLFVVRWIVAFDCVRYTYVLFSDDIPLMMYSC